MDLVRLLADRQGPSSEQVEKERTHTVEQIKHAYNVCFVDRIAQLLTTSVATDVDRFVVVCGKVSKAGFLKYSKVDIENCFDFLYLLIGDRYESLNVAKFRQALLELNEDHDFGLTKTTNAMFLFTWAKTQSEAIGGLWKYARRQITRNGETMCDEVVILRSRWYSLCSSSI